MDRWRERIVALWCSTSAALLIDWDPRHLYRKLFAGEEAAMEHFLATICTHEWNRGQDAGRSFAEGCHLLKIHHPEKAELIDAYAARFSEMMAGPIAGSVEILAELKASGTALYGLTNFSAETYPMAFERFEFLRWFRGIVVSGEVGVITPRQAPSLPLDRGDYGASLR
jgi:2-haloacid dehalogenase